MFDVIVIYSIDLSWTQRMGRELQHRTTTILSVHHVLMSPLVVGDDIAWCCYYVQRGDVTVIIVQSTTLNTDIESYEALPTLSIHWITFALSNHSQRRHRIYIIHLVSWSWVTLLSDSHYNFIQNFDRLRRHSISSLQLRPSPSSTSRNFALKYLIVWMGSCAWAC